MNRADVSLSALLWGLRLCGAAAVLFVALWVDINDWFDGWGPDSQEHDQ